MSYLGSDLQTSLAYRLGETAAPSDTNTKNQRYNWLSEAYFDIARRKNWSWLEATSTANTNTGSTTGYPEPTDLKEFIELQINNIYFDEVDYRDNRIYRNTLGVVQLPSLRRNYKFYRFGGRYFLIPTDGNDGLTHTIKYYKRVTKISVDADTVLIPDEYTPSLTAYAEARYWLSITQQAKAAAPFQEYEEIVQQMTVENNRLGMSSPGNRIHDPENVFSQ